MYGQIFTGITLTVSTASGQLPEFTNTNTYFFMPPPAFATDCSSSSTTTMDCSAQTAILAYFAGPPIGGANAKATQEDGLTARGGSADLPLASAGVKWLSQQTSAGPSVLKGSPALVSRMLGGLQLGNSFSGLHFGFDPRLSKISVSTTMTDIENEGCLVKKTCKPVPPPEDALLRVLKVFFQGTGVASDFGEGAASNNGEPVTNAPINYLQVWENDFVYAAGWGNETCISAMYNNPPSYTVAPPPGCTPEKMNTVPFMGSAITAQDLLRTPHGPAMSGPAYQESAAGARCQDRKAARSTKPLAAHGRTIHSGSTAAVPIMWRSSPKVTANACTERSFLRRDARCRCLFFQIFVVCSGVFGWRRDLAGHSFVGRAAGLMLH